MKKRHYNHPNNGFTLVELSIVLVIIGLVVGGVLVGADLIRQAEIRSTITERDNITAAINTFRAKYGSLPGDMRDATRWWPAVDPDDATCRTMLPGPIGETCNGDGDKTIFQLSKGSSWETFTAMQQLSLAGLIPASLNGGPGPDGFLDMEINENTLGSKIDGAAWLLQYAGTVTVASKAAVAPFMDQFYEGKFSHMLGLARLTSLGAGIGDVTGAPSFSVEEAYALDLKVDDGKPGTGVLKSWRPTAAPNAYANDCADDTNPRTAEYNLGAGIQCTLLFKVRF